MNRLVSSLIVCLVTLFCYHLAFAASYVIDPTTGIAMQVQGGGEAPTPVIVQGNGMGKPYEKKRSYVSKTGIRHTKTIAIIVPHKEPPKPRYESYEQPVYESECGSDKSLVTIQDKKGFTVDSYCE